MAAEHPAPATGAPPLPRAARIGLALLVAVTVVVCALAGWLVSDPALPAIPLPARPAG
ncbi:hypothetical protein GC722_15160 [Auraticoccus sp. F435]|uniref:Uncharacterized protein n=1 Tax=Auraticoccus cholistanensis TaxID=2656650 RepID=A0A6A9V1F9_9ACTN|nr:hypothetical protein [Auraticoccus cholistanensis]MVA77349.1 hypothetical protein [Auraticoccus cholistanensis]